MDLQGHRGARGMRPENTLPAFEYCIKQKMTSLELDTVVTKDNQLIIFHDTKLNGKLCLDAEVVAGPAESFGNWQAVDCAMSRALRPSKDLLQTLQDNNVHFLHFRGERKEESLDSWKLTAEQHFPLSDNRWVSLYVPIVSRETSVDR